MKKRKKRKKLKKKYSVLLAALCISAGVLLTVNNNAIQTDYSEYSASAKEVPVGVSDTTAATGAAAAETATINAPVTDAGIALSDELDRLNETYPDQVGFVLINEATGETIATNESRIFTSASLYKLFLTYAVLEKVDKGELALTDVMDDTLEGYSGATIDDYLTDTITLSVNETAHALAHLIGWENLESFIHENGFEDTTFNPYLETDGIYYSGTLQTTPAEVAELLERLLKGELLSESSTSYFLYLLADQQLVYALNTGLTDEVAFAHKTGILDDVSHDAGIITLDGQDYIVAVLTDGWGAAIDEATPVFESVGASIMNYLHATGTE